MWIQRRNPLRSRFLLHDSTDTDISFSLKISFTGYYVVLHFLVLPKKYFSRFDLSCLLAFLPNFYLRICWMSIWMRERRALTLSDICCLECLNFKSLFGKFQIMFWEKSLDIVADFGIWFIICTSRTNLGYVKKVSSKNLFATTTLIYLNLRSFFD